jgi:hypothetical protein
MFIFDCRRNSYVNTIISMLMELFQIFGNFNPYHCNLALHLLKRYSSVRDFPKEGQYRPKHVGGTSHCHRRLSIIDKESVRLNTV